MHGSFKMINTYHDRGNDLDNCHDNTVKENDVCYRGRESVDDCTGKDFYGNCLVCSHHDIWNIFNTLRLGLCSVVFEFCIFMSQESNQVL